MPVLSDFTPYATSLSEKWDLIRAEQRELIESSRQRTRLIEGLPDEIVRDYIWPVLHSKLIEDAGTADGVAENVRFLLSLLGFNVKLRLMVAYSSMCGVLRMMRAEFSEFENPMSDDDGMRFLRRLMDSFPNMHLLGHLSREHLDEFRVKWIEWDLHDHVYFMTEFCRIEHKKFLQRGGIF
ncbi:unnamed protein product [Calypogeia fissa]